MTKTGKAKQLGKQLIGYPDEVVPVISSKDYLSQYAHNPGHHVRTSDTRGLPCSPIPRSPRTSSGCSRYLDGSLDTVSFFPSVDKLYFQCLNFVNRPWMVDWGCHCWLNCWHGPRSTGYVVRPGKPLSLATMSSFSLYVDCYALARVWSLFFLCWRPDLLCRYSIQMPLTYAHLV